MLSPALRRYQPAALCLGVLALLALALAPAPAQTLGHGGSYLVGFRGRVDAGLVSAAGGQVTRTFHLIPALAARLSTPAAQQLARHPQVAYVEPDAPAYAYYSPSEYLPWGIERVGAPLAWAGLQGLLPNTAAGFKVALLDTGVDYTHPDLAACYAGGVDIVNGDGDPRDDNGHGTHCAGIIAAADDGPNQGGRNSGYCVVGVAPGARIVAVKVLGAQGSGSYSQVIAGLAPNGHHHRGGSQP